MDTTLTEIFTEALTAAGRKGPRPVVEAQFYPYAGLSSTIRLRQGRIFVRVSDILRDSPREVLNALARILIAKLYRLRTPLEHQRIYRGFASSPAILSATEHTRRTRGFKMTTSSAGVTHDLDKAFDRLNHKYFGGSIERPVLSWSQRRTRRVLGHHDAVHGTIIISRTLDDPKVPQFLVDYVLFHEMLHVRYPAKRAGHRTIYHDDTFRAAERKFDKFNEAQQWMDRLAYAPRRRRKKDSRKAP